jgi:serine/threonine-protein phosphatase 6 regulatory ankyrin repeat subunit B
LFIDTATLRKRIDRGWDVKHDGPLLMESAIYWDAAGVVALLAHSGVDASGGPDGKTYLTIAIEANRPACVRALIAAGARLDAGSQRDRNAAVAAAGHSLELVQIVVAQGLSVNTRKGAGTGFAVGATMLMAAIVSEHIDIVRWLLDHGARIDNVDNEGHTALMTAAGAGSPDIVALLLSRNAAPDLRDRQAAAMIAEAGANSMQGELDALRQSGSPVGPNDLAYFEGRIANWRAIVALLAQR